MCIKCIFSGTSGPRAGASRLCPTTRSTHGQSMPLAVSIARSRSTSGGSATAQSYGLGRDRRQDSKGELLEVSLSLSHRAFRGGKRELLGAQPGAQSQVADADARSVTASGQPKGAQFQRRRSQGTSDQTRKSSVGPADTPTLGSGVRRRKLDWRKCDDRKAMKDQA